MYNGDFYKGQLHGAGELALPDGSTVACTWKNGKLVRGQIVFKDGLKAPVVRDTDINAVQRKLDSWSYCTDKDRRFASEIGARVATTESGLGPTPTHSTPHTLFADDFESARPVLATLPPGWFDVGDGLLDPVTSLVHTPSTNLTCDEKVARQQQVLRTASPAELLWAQKKCRVGEARPRAAVPVPVPVPQPMAKRTVPAKEPTPVRETRPPATGSKVPTASATQPRPVPASSSRPVHISSQVEYDPGSQVLRNPALDPRVRKLGSRSVSSNGGASAGQARHDRPYSRNQRDHCCVFRSEVQAYSWPPALPSVAD